MNADPIPSHWHEVPVSIAGTKSFYAHFDRFDVFAGKTPVTAWGLKSSWEIAAIQPVLHGVGGSHSKQCSSLRAGERVCLSACHQALNQVAAASIPQGSSHVVEEAWADRAHVPILGQTVKTVSIYSAAPTAAPPRRWPWPARRGSCPGSKQLLRRWPAREGLLRRGGRGVRQGSCWRRI